jgi:hypothetical protein
MISIKDILVFFAHLAMKDFKWKTRIIDKDQNYKEHAFLVFFPWKFSEQFSMRLH